MDSQFGNYKKSPALITSLDIYFKKKWDKLKEKNYSINPEAQSLPGIFNFCVWCAHTPGWERSWWDPEQDVTVEHKSFSEKQLAGVEFTCMIDSLTKQTQLTIHQGFLFCQSTLAPQMNIRHTSYHNEWDFVNVCVYEWVYSVQEMFICPLKRRFPFLLRLALSVLFFKSWMLFRNPASSLHISSLHFPSSLHLIWISDYLFLPINYILNDTAAATIYSERF